jgi:hypothetical protein
MALNDIYKVVIHQRLHGGEVLNIWYFVDDFGVAGGAGHLAADIRDNLGTTMRARATSDVTFEFVEATKIVPYGAGPETASWPANTVGTTAGNSATGTMCEVITVYTASIGRRHRGRMYLAGIGQTAATGGSIVAAQTTKTQAFATAMANRYIAMVGQNQYRFGVWSKTIAGPDPPWSTDAFTRATSLTVRTLVRNQRRRQVGVGR